MDVATKAKSPREIGETFDELAIEIEDGRELDRRLKIPEGCPRRRRRALIEALADKLGFPDERRFSQSQVLGRLRLSEGLEQEHGKPLSVDLPEAVSHRKSGPPKSLPVNGAEFRDFRGVHSQEDFAEICGVSPSTIYRAESGRPIRGLKKIVERANKNRKTNQKTIADLTSVTRQ